MAIQVWSIGLQKHTKMIENYVHIRYIDHFKQVGVREKNDRNEINSVDDHCVWLCVRISTPHRSEKFNHHSSHVSSPQCGLCVIVHNHPGRFNLYLLQQYQKG